MAEEPKKPKKGQIKVGQHVWVKDAAIAGTDLFCLGHVLAIDEKDKVTVETNNGTKAQELVLPLSECHQPHPGDDVPDHCQLMYLSQPTLLENTKVRYMADKIYTYVGTILVAVNPFRMIPGIYDESQMALCKGKKLHNAGTGPHVFATSEQAYAAMQKSKKNQCIVVSGESGAGKTETNRQLMKYLIWRGKDVGAEDVLTGKIMDTNPLLEAFGNAKTTRNNNSSRFGRYVLVRFNDACEVVGAQVRVFLLERSRVTSTSKAKERAYHVMYQLCKGGTPHTSGQAPDYFHYMSMSGQVDCPGQNDAEEFKVTSNALLSVGLSADELDQIWAFLAGMLYIGNVTFGDGDTAVISATGDGDPIRMAEKLMGVGDMTQLLIQQEMIIGGEVTYKALSVTQANQGRDALVKIMYARLFDYLVVRINQTVDDVAKAKLYIGLLDVYGFEFFEVNSFEQVRTTCTCPRAHAHVHMPTCTGGNRWKQVGRGRGLCEMWMWPVLATRGVHYAMHALMCRRMRCPRVHATSMRACARRHGMPTCIRMLVDAAAHPLHACTRPLHSYASTTRTRSCSSSS